MKYKIIYADPAWKYNDKNHRGGAERHYQTTSIPDLTNLNVAKLCDTDCVLFMWVTFPMLAEGLELMKAWGFKYKTNAFTWIKKNKKQTDTNFLGMGNWTRSNPEICLLGVKGKPKRISAKVRQIIESPLRGHSQKPPEVRDRIIELMGDLPRLEMFAREQTDGWDVFGNEVENSITIEVKP